MENASPIETKKEIKLVFRVGEKKDLISKYDGKITLLDRELKELPVAGLSYTCELKPMLKGNGWIVIGFEKTVGIKVNLVFKKGKRMYNEKTETYKENMVSTYESKIVIAPEDMVLERYMEYECDIVLSPSGRAYIVEKAELAKEVEAEIISSPFPISCVEVKIRGVLHDDFRFDAAEDNEEEIEWKALRLSKRSIIDKDLIISNYKAA